jgi:hypothetical protein
MSRQSDLVLFGPRLALALGSEAASRVAGLLRAAARVSGDGASREWATATAAAPAVEVDSAEAESDGLEPVSDLPEVITEVPQAIDGGFPR